MSENEPRHGWLTLSTVAIVACCTMLAALCACNPSRTSAPAPPVAPANLDESDGHALEAGLVPPLGSATTAEVEEQLELVVVAINDHLRVLDILRTNSMPGFSPPSSEALTIRMHTILTNSLSRADLLSNLRVVEVDLAKEIESFGNLMRADPPFTGTPLRWSPK
jgi:hypothetical protein